MKWLIATIGVCLLLLLPSLAAAQVPPVQNPSALTFDSTDHAVITSYEIDVLKATGAIDRTIAAGKGTQDATGTVTLAFNAQPIPFGTYTVKVRGLVTMNGVTIKSKDSVASDPFERVPGQPVNIKIK